MAGLSGPIKSSYGDMNAAPGSRPEDYQKPAITGPVGGNFANKLGALRQNAQKSTIRANTTVGKDFSLLPMQGKPGALPEKPIRPVNLGKNKGGVPYYSEKPTLQRKSQEFRQDQGLANKNNQTPANKKNTTPRSQG